MDSKKNKKTTPKQSLEMDQSKHSISEATQRTPNRVQARTAKRKLHQGQNEENGDLPSTPTSGDEKSLAKRKRRNSSNSCTSSPSGFLKPALTERQQLALLLQMTDPHKQQQGQSPTVEGSPRDTPGRSKVHKRNERGETPLHVACIKGDSTAVLNLLGQGAEIDVSDNAGWTPLHEACNHGHSDVVSILINKGANINVRGMGGDTPLHDAVVNDHSEVVELLLSKGADPKMANSNHQTPLDICKDSSISSLLRKRLSTMDEGSSEKEDVFTDDGVCTPKRVRSRHTRTPPPASKVKKELVQRAETPPPCLKLLPSRLNTTRVQGRHVITNSRGSFYSDLSSSESDSDGIDQTRGRDSYTDTTALDNKVQVKDDCQDVMVVNGEEKENGIENEMMEETEAVKDSEGKETESSHEEKEQLPPQEDVTSPVTSAPATTAPDGDGDDGDDGDDDDGDDDVHVPVETGLKSPQNVPESPSKSTTSLPQAVPITLTLKSPTTCTSSSLRSPHESKPSSPVTTDTTTSITENGSSKTIPIQGNNVSSLVVSFGLDLFNNKTETSKPVTNGDDTVLEEVPPVVSSDEQMVTDVPLTTHTQEQVHSSTPETSSAATPHSSPTPPSPLILPASINTSPRGSTRSSPTTPSFPSSPRCSVSIMSGKPRRVASIDEVPSIVRDSVPPTDDDDDDDDDSDSVSTVVSFSTSLPIVFSSLTVPSSLRSSVSRNGSPKKSSRSSSLSPSLLPSAAVSLLATPTQSGSVSPPGILNPVPAPDQSTPIVKDDVIHEEETQLQPPPMKKSRNNPLPLPSVSTVTTPHSQESRKSSSSSNISPMNEDLHHLPPKRRITRQVYKSNIITQRQSVHAATPPVVPHNYDSFLTSKHSYRSLSVPPPRFPQDVYPPLLPSQHKLFSDQEQERMSILSTHLNEVDRLVVCFEQELTRAYQKATGPSSYPPVNACAVFIERLHQGNLPTSTTQSSILPLSNINHEQLLTSYVQDVWDKYHRCSELLASRHKMEVEALWLSQRQQWIEWNKDVTVSSLVISHVPVAHTGTFPKYVR